MDVWLSHHEDSNRQASQKLGVDMSYIADDITEIAGHYGFAGSVQEVDNVTTFTSNDGTLRVVARHELEATLTMTHPLSLFVFAGCFSFFDQY